MVHLIGTRGTGVRRRDLVLRRGGRPPYHRGGSPPSAPPRGQARSTVAGVVIGSSRTAIGGRPGRSRHGHRSIEDVLERCLVPLGAGVIQAAPGSRETPGHDPLEGHGHARRRRPDPDDRSSTRSTRLARSTRGKEHGAMEGRHGMKRRRRVVVGIAALGTLLAISFAGTALAQSASTSSSERRDPADRSISSEGTTNDICHGQSWNALETPEYEVLSLNFDVAPQLRQGQPGGIAGAWQPPGRSRRTVSRGRSRSGTTRRGRTAQPLTAKRRRLHLQHDARLQARQLPRTTSCRATPTRSPRRTTPPSCGP